MSDFLMHHGILGQKWGVRRYQNKDGSLTAEGRSRYLKEGSEERKALDKSASRAGLAEFNLDDAVENYINRAQSKRLKELKSDKNFAGISDEDLVDYYMDDVYDEAKAKEHVRKTNKKLAKEYDQATMEYEQNLRKMYDSVKDEKLNKIKVDKTTKDGFEQFKKLYENELWISNLKENYGKNWKTEYDELR